MTVDGFRKLALELPATVEGSHMGHADFRVGGKVFAALPPRGHWEMAEGPVGMVKLSRADQVAVLAASPTAFAPAPGAWGRQGCTFVLLSEVRHAVLKRAMAAAWRNRAPASLVRELELASAPKRRR